jgi:hypothetical protein
MNITTLDKAIKDLQALWSEDNSKKVADLLNEAITTIQDNTQIWIDKKLDKVPDILVNLYKNLAKAAENDSDDDSPLIEAQYTVGDMIKEFPNSSDILDNILNWQSSDANSSTTQVRLVQSRLKQAMPSCFLPTITEVTEQEDLSLLSTVDNETTEIVGDNTLLEAAHSTYFI